MDPYKVLGVLKSSSESEIRQSYKKLAKKYHPDNKDTGNAEKMSEINNAYDKISDRNNKFIQDGVNKPRRSTNYEDILNTFNMEYVFKQNSKNNNVIVDLNITLLDAYTGTDKQLEVLLPDKTTRSIHVQIPPGIKNDSKIVFEYEGLKTTNVKGDALVGNLIVRINIQEDKMYIRQDENLLIKIRIDCVDAMLGCSYKIVTLDKKVLNLKIPPGVQFSQILRIKNHGMPIMNQDCFGDLLVEILVDTLRIDEKQRKIVEMIK